MLRERERENKISNILDEFEQRVNNGNFSYKAKMQRKKYKPLHSLRANLFCYDTKDNLQQLYIHSLGNGKNGFTYMTHIRCTFARSFYFITLQAF